MVQCSGRSGRDTGRVPGLPLILLLLAPVHTEREETEERGPDPPNLASDVLRPHLSAKEAAIEKPPNQDTSLFIDIEEFTRLLQLGDLYADVLAMHHRLLRTAIQRAQGQVVETQGDAVFAAPTYAMR